MTTPVAAVQQEAEVERLLRTGQMTPARRVTKHGTKGTPGYRLLHPGRGRGASRDLDWAAAAQATGKRVKVRSVSQALVELHKGNAVELRHTRQVGTLLDRLAALVDEAKAKGEKAPNINLCRVSVRGTNLFCAQSKGIPRLQMPQLSARPTPGTRAATLPRDSRGYVDAGPEFRNYLADRGVKITDTTKLAAELKASQNELNGANVARIARVLAEGRGNARQLFVSRDDYIVDGHHNWAAVIGNDSRDDRTGDLSLDVAQVDMDILDLLVEAHRFAAEWGIAPRDVTKRKETAVQWKLDVTNGRLVAKHGSKGDPGYRALHPPRDGKLWSGDSEARLTGISQAGRRNSDGSISRFMPNGTEVRIHPYRGPVHGSFMEEARRHGGVKRWMAEDVKGLSRRIAYALTRGAAAVGGNRNSEAFAKASIEEQIASAIEAELKAAADAGATDSEILSRAMRAGAAELVRMTSGAPARKSSLAFRAGRLVGRVAKHGSKGSPGYAALHPNSRGPGKGRKAPSSSTPSSKAPAPIRHVSTADAATTELGDTEKLHMVDGKWTPERKRLHDKIIAKYLAGQTRKDKPRALFMGGGSASGKSTVLSAGQRTEVGVVIDADAIKGELPEYQKMLRAKDPRAASFVHEESSYLSKEIMRQAGEGQVDFTLDGTGDSTLAKLRSKVEAARKGGHSVDALYVTVDTDTAVQRSNERGAKTGRLVPESVVREIHASVSSVFPEAIEADLFDTVELWDTGTTPPTLLGSKPPGGKWAVHNGDGYQAFLDKAKVG